MHESILKSDIEGLKEKLEKLSEEQRITRIQVMEKIDRSSSKIIAAIFSESRRIRGEIGYQTIVLKTLEDNLSDTRFDEDTGVASKIEISVGSEVFGTGAKWVLDVDIGKASYDEILKAIQHAPKIPNKVKDLAKSKLGELCN